MFTILVKKKKKNSNNDIKKKRLRERVRKWVKENNANGKKR